MSTICIIRKVLTTITKVFYALIIIKKIYNLFFLRFLIITCPLRLRSRKAESLFMVSFQSIFWWTDFLDEMFLFPFK